MTNHRRLWSDPASRRKPTNDREFRISEGSTLTGTLRWADGAYVANERTLAGQYVTRWFDYSNVGGPNGVLRWLAIEVKP